jgi:hypothetical protein
VSTTRFLTLNATDRFSTTLDTAHGTTRHDDPSGRFPFENALNPDRRQVWKSDGSSNVVVTIKNSSFFDMESVAVLGISTEGTIDSVEVSFSVDGATWFATPRPTLNLSGVRDAGAFVVARNFWPIYARFSFTNTGAFSIGRIFLGLQTDTGKVHSPGGEDTVFKNRLELGSDDGNVNVVPLGYDGENISLPFRSLKGLERNTLRSVAAWPGSVVLFDTEDRVLECIVNGGQVKTVRTFVDTYDCILTLTRLP